MVSEPDPPVAPSAPIVAHETLDRITSDTAKCLSEPQEDAILRRLDGVAGWLSHAEARLLMQMVARTVSRFGETHAIVEVGSYCGRSTIVMASAASLVGNSALYAIDPHLGELGAVDSDIGFARVRGTFEEFSKNLEDAGVAALVEPILLHSFEVEWNRPFGLLFHSTDCTIAPASSRMPSISSTGSQSVGLLPFTTTAICSRGLWSMSTNCSLKAGRV